jgi:hypothetical protein
MHSYANKTLILSRNLKSKVNVVTNVIHSPEPALLQYPRLLSLIVGALVEVKIHQPFLFSYAMLSFLLIAIFLCLTA